MYYIDNCRYEIQEQNEFWVRYTGIYRPIWSTVYMKNVCISAHVYDVCICFAIHDNNYTIYCQTRLLSDKEMYHLCFIDLYESLKQIFQYFTLIYMAALHCPSCLLPDFFRLPTVACVRALN
jgi:hypothetical protein